MLHYLLGIWIRDIRFKSNLPMTQVNKIVKNLESKKLIKAVKSVAVSITRYFVDWNDTMWLCSMWVNHFSYAQFFNSFSLLSLIVNSPPKLLHISF